MTIKEAGLPVGRQDADFQGAEETYHEEWHEGLMWKFRAYDGEFFGKESRRTTGPDPTPGNACGAFLAGLADKSPDDGLDLDPDDHIGQKYVIDVVKSKNGKGTRVERIIRPVESKETKTADDAGNVAGSMDEQAEELF